MSQYKPGARLRSAVCATEVVVIAAPDNSVALNCGGAPLLLEGEQVGEGLQLEASAAEGTQLGKRYTNETGDLELLCVKPGEGTLAAEGVALVQKGAKPLPSSD
ncbi:MAG: hypothetical protein OSA45_06370 [Halioglobus sp.]|jgi:hypothetical protein|nr:hypothetical protein [Halioglobus sp.]